MLRAVIALQLLATALSGAVDVCPGEGPRYGDYKCNHDGTHRVCAQLVDESSGAPLSWGEGGDFWAIAGQQTWQWDDAIVSEPNPGDSWCICMWAFARVRGLCRVLRRRPALRSAHLPIAARHPRSSSTAWAVRMCTFDATQPTSLLC